MNSGSVKAYISFKDLGEEIMVEIIGMKTKSCYDYDNVWSQTYDY